jgi:hypothetical protein
MSTLAPISLCLPHKSFLHTIQGLKSSLVHMAYVRFLQEFHYLAIV